MRDERKEYERQWEIELKAERRLPQFKRSYSDPVKDYELHLRPARPYYWNCAEWVAELGQDDDSLAY